MSDAVRRAAFQWRMALVFAAVFAPLGVFSPFFPVWLAHEGVGPDDIALLLAAQTAVRVLVSPPVLGIADRAPDRAFVLIAAGIGTALAMQALFVVEGFPAIFVAMMVLACFWAPLAPLSDAIALSGVRRVGIDYGRARLWGSVGFIAANLFGGVVLARFGVVSVLPMLSASFVAGALAFLLTPRVGRPRQASALPPQPLPEPAPPLRPARLGARFVPKPDLRTLLPAILAIALVQASHGAFYAFGGIHLTALGYSGTAIGVFWAVGVVAEVMTFRFAGRMTKRFGARAFLIAGGTAAVLRWSLFGFDLGLVGFTLLQTLHGLTFAATHCALQYTIAAAIPEERLGRAQGLAFGVQTTCVALATLAAGPLYRLFGGESFLAAAGVALAGVALALVAVYPQRAGRGGETVEPS